MAKYQKYAEYKGIKSLFIESIPMGWNIQPLYTLCEFQQGKAHEPFIDDDGDHICVNARFVSTQGGSFKYCNVNLTPAKLNDVLMVMSDLPNGRALARAFFVKEEKSYAVNQRVCAITAKKVNSKFLYYQLNRSPYFLMFDDGSNQTHLSNDTYKKYPVLLPSLNEQEKIANFLDHETSKIDTLIAKQEKLIALLKEKRQAVISHAVTKGLNPNVPMKDSGVEWLGKVPEHWGVSTIGYYAKVTNGTTPSKANLSFWDKDEIPWLSSGEVNQYHINEASEHITQKALQECSLELLPIGTVVMGMIGQGKTRGLSAITKIEATINQNLAALETYSRLNNEYLHYYLQAAYVYIREEGRGGNQAALNCEIIKKFSITIPPYEEQIKIVEQIKNLSETYKALIYKAESAIKLMQERRTALISAAVTGKIDVRHWQHPNQKNEADVELSA